MRTPRANKNIIRNMFQYVLYCHRWRVFYPPRGVDNERVRVGEKKKVPCASEQRPRVWNILNVLLSSPSWYTVRCRLCLVSYSIFFFVGFSQIYWATSRIPIENETPESPAAFANASGRRDNKPAGGQHTAGTYDLINWVKPLCNTRRSFRSSTLAAQYRCGRLLFVR